MAIPETNFNPPFNITRASHLVLTAQDLPASRDFYTEVLGLVVSDEDANTIFLRGIEERGHHSLTLKKTSAEPTCECVGMHVFSEEDLDKAKFYFDRADVPAKFIEVPFQTRTLRFSDVMGTTVDLCATMQTKPRLHVQAHIHRGGRALRMDHYQVLVPDVLTAAKFYMDLGFRISDYLVIPGADVVIGTFLYRKNNPWDIVFLHRSGPRFHHCGYVVESLYDIIRGLDTAGNIGFGECIEHGPGRHGTWAGSKAPRPKVEKSSDIPITCTCAIPTDIGPSCCCPRFRSSTVTTNLSRACWIQTQLATAGASRHPAAGLTKPTHLPG